jgi:phosphoserine phosphatase
VQLCLGGVPRAELIAYTGRFVSRLLNGGMCSRALAELDSHRARGTHLVLLSASPDVYVREIAARLGFHECICTELLWDCERLTGTFTSPNRRAAEKATVVRAIRQRIPGSIAGYANSASDLLHLELMEHPVLVNGSRAARRLAVKRGISCELWR